MNSTKAWLACSAAICGLAPGLAFAEPGGPAQVEEIIVTAEKRATNLQTTPISISAVTAEALEARGVTNLFDLANFTPNLVSSSGTVSSNDGNYFIRGIGQQDAFSNVEPGAGTYIDGVYLGRTAGAALDLVSVERIEVLRGPQGTLFGRNTIGGAISIITRKPGPEFEAKGLVRLGERERRDAELGVNLPLTERLAARLQVVARNRDGDATRAGPDPRRAGEEDTLAARLAVRLEPTDDLTFDLAWDNTKKRGTTQCSYSLGFNPASPGIPAGAVGQVLRDRDRCYSSVADNSARLDAAGLTFTGEWRVGEVTVRSISSYRRLKQYAPVDNDGSTFNLYDLIIHKGQEQYSQELQLTGVALDDRLNWLVGAYYFDEDIREQQQLTFAVRGPTSFRLRDFSPSTRSYAGFAQATFDVTEKASLTLGLRATRDEKSMAARNVDLNAGVYTTVVNAAVSKDWTSVTPKAVAQYRFTPEVMGYLSYSEGFRSGGFNARARAAGQLIPFDPEKAKVFEAGVKADLFDNRLRVNGAAWFNDYKKIQILALADGFFSNRNAGDAELYGVELEATARPTAELTLNAGLGYTHAEYVKLQPGAGLTTDSKLPFVPKWSLSAGAQYARTVELLGRVQARVDWSYRSRMNVFSPVSLQPGYSLVNARLSVSPTERLEIAAYAQNLFDKQYTTFRSVDLSGAPGSLGISNAFLGPPGELGLELITRF